MQAIGGKIRRGLDLQTVGCQQSRPWQALPELRLVQAGEKLESHGLACIVTPRLSHVCLCTKDFEAVVDACRNGAGTRQITACRRTPLHTAPHASPQTGGAPATYIVRGQLLGP